MAQKIMIASGKGGVGKSTVGAITAAALAKLSQKVLLVEADSGFRSLDVFFSLHDRAIYDFEDLLESRCSLETAILKHPSGVSLVPAPVNTGYIPSRERLEAFFTYADLTFDYIIVDTAAGCGDWHRLFASICDLALIVATPDLISSRAAAAMSRELKKSGCTEQRLIINKIPKKIRRSSGITDLDEVIDLVGIQLIAAVPFCKNIHMPSDGSREAAYEELFRLAKRLTGESSPLTIYP